MSAATGTLALVRPRPLEGDADTMQYITQCPRYGGVITTPLSREQLPSNPRLLKSSRSMLR